MRYLAGSRLLLDSRGEILKHLDCPLRKRWEQLQVLDTVGPHGVRPHPLKRHCESCDKDVIDITGFDESAVAALLQVNPDACVHASTASRHIEFVDAEKSREGGRESAPVGLPVYTCHHHSVEVPIVRTARTISAINEAALDGYWPLIKPVAPSAEIKTKRIVLQRQNGTIEISGDLRSGAGAPTFWYNPYRSALPFAAYLIPPGLERGARVFLPDLIEDIAASGWNQGDKFRQRCGYALWTGSDLELENAEYVEVVG